MGPLTLCLFVLDAFWSGPSTRLTAFRMQLVQLVDSLHSYIMHQAMEPALVRWLAASTVLRRTAPGAADDATLAALVAAHEELVQDVWTGCLLDDDVRDGAGWACD